MFECWRVTILPKHTTCPHEIIEQQHNGLFPKKEVVFFCLLIIYSCLSKKIILYIVSALHNWEILESKEICAHLKPDLTECHQRIVSCYAHIKWETIVFWVPTSKEERNFEQLEWLPQRCWPKKLVLPTKQFIHIWGLKR